MTKETESPGSQELGPALVVFRFATIEFAAMSARLSFLLDMLLLSKELLV
jgi:hypothetical protein